MFTSTSHIPTKYNFEFNHINRYRKVFAYFYQRKNIPTQFPNSTKGQLLSESFHGRSGFIRVNRTDKATTTRPHFLICNLWVRDFLLEDTRFVLCLPAPERFSVFHLLPPLPPVVQQESVDSRKSSSRTL